MTNKLAGGKGCISVASATIEIPAVEKTEDEEKPFEKGSTRSRLVSSGDEGQQTFGALL